ncbi:unnamed protein product [Closterium sp. NIES-54]
MAPIAGNGASGSSSLYKVWEIRALKRQKRSDEARGLLERMAKQVEPIMARRRWKVPLLSEFSPSNARLLGLNINRGREIRIRLRPAGKPDSFFPYEHVLGTMLHELTHIERGPHDAKFYKLLDELNEECDDLIARGITGTPFGGSGHRLGSSGYPSIRPVRLGTVAAAAAAGGGASLFGVLSAAAPSRGVVGASSAPSAADVASRKAAAAAAERRRQQQRIMMPAGGRRLGGDSEIMKVLSPVQAAAMAAERRMRDDVWCGGHGSGGGEGGEGGEMGQGGAREKEEEEWENAREVGEGVGEPQQRVSNGRDDGTDDGKDDGRDDGRDDSRGGMAMGEGYGGGAGSRLERDERGAGGVRLRSGSVQSDVSRRQGIRHGDCNCNCNCDCNGGCDCVQVANGIKTGDMSRAGGTRKRPSDSLEQSSRRRKVTAGGAAVGSAAGGENSGHSTRFSRGVREEDAAGGEQRADRADTWACPVCTLINRCEACFAVRPSSRPAFDGASVTVAAGTSASVNAKAAMVIGVSNAGGGVGGSGGAAAAAGTSASAAIVIDDTPAAAAIVVGGGGGGDVGTSTNNASTGAMWSCGLCTLENAASVTRCLACDSLRVSKT